MTCCRQEQSGAKRISPPAGEAGLTVQVISLQFLRSISEKKGEKEFFILKKCNRRFNVF